MLETYGIFDYRRVEPQLLAVLTLGLKDDSRVKLAIAGTNIKQETLLLAAAVDQLSFIAWTKTKSAGKNKNRPKSLVDLLTSNEQSNENASFDTSDDFEAARAKILRGENLWPPN